MIVHVAYTMLPQVARLVDNHIGKGKGEREGMETRGRVGKGRTGHRKESVVGRGRTMKHQLLEN